MATTKKGVPAHNYAKPVSELPPLRKEVTDTLSNQFDNEKSYNSYKDSQDKTYFIHHNQAYYRGPWINGLPQGKGICIFADGSYYEGNFVSGDAEDHEGFLVLVNGAVYKGSIKRSVIQGEGLMKHSVGKESFYVYNGSWKAGKPDGKGIQEYGDGSIYKGCFKEGLKHSFDESKTIKQKEEQFKANGKLSSWSHYQSATGEVYNGEFMNGRMHGFGDYVGRNKSVKYTGQFYNGKKQGFGSLHTQTGTLTGYFENDVVNGPGKFEWIKYSKDDGRTYIGNFKNSKFHGEGKIQLQNGNVLQGTWQDGHSIELRSVKANTS